MLTDQYSFSDTRERIDTLLQTMKNIPGNWMRHIFDEIIIKEFRDFYTPEINNKNDRTLFIKNQVFEFIFDNKYEDIPFHVIKMNPDYNHGMYEYDKGEIISFTEFLFVYANPEGTRLLEKIQFIITDTDWAVKQEKLEQDIRDAHDDFDDDIPF